MADVTAENILAAAAVESDAMDTKPSAAEEATVTDAAAAATVAAAATATPASVTPAAAAVVVPVPVGTAAAAPVPNRPFNLRWLQAADKNRQHFADDLFNSVFTQESVEKVVQELKTITATKIANSYRLCEDDHTYSVQIASHGWLRVPTHLMRM